MCCQQMAAFVLEPYPTLGRPVETVRSMTLHKVHLITVRTLLSCCDEVPLCCTVAADDPIVHTSGGGPTDIKRY